MTAKNHFLPMVFLCAFIVFSPKGWAGSSLDALKKFKSSALLVVDQKGNETHSRRSDSLFIPASTVKILTALIALEHWGDNYRFTTGFYLDRPAKRLWVKGRGDPFLISEELDLIVAELKRASVKELFGIGVDSRYFGEPIIVDGQSSSDNPYDAPVGALAANFNTINVRIKGTKVISAEPQTPLTPLTKKLSSGLANGKHRINLGSADKAPRYFAELLIAKLNLAGIKTRPNVVLGSVSNDAKAILMHSNSNRLKQVIASMLRYSNNFIANQLYLALGADVHGAPATMAKSRKVVADYINKNFGWKRYVLIEGAGLSRRNRLSARQLIDTLRKFRQYRHLMPAQNKNIRAKTGTLYQVSTYAGYLNRKNKNSMFAILINQRVRHSFRKQLAMELLAQKR